MSTTEALRTEDEVREELRSGFRGHFAAHLADAYDFADSTNRRKLRETWPDLFDWETES